MFKQIIFKKPRIFILNRIWEGQMHFKAEIHDFICKVFSICAQQLIGLASKKYVININCDIQNRCVFLCIYKAVSFRRQLIAKVVWNRTQRMFYLFVECARSISNNECVEILKVIYKPFRKNYWAGGKMIKIFDFIDLLETIYCKTSILRYIRRGEISLRQFIAWFDN